VRAARCRGFRIRSPSSPNELIEKDSRQKSPATPGFFFGPVLRLMLRRETISWRSNFYLVRFCRTQDVFAQESLQACRNIDGRDHAKRHLK
jgi:hypothetical protein